VFLASSKSFPSFSGFQIYLPHVDCGNRSAVTCVRIFISPPVCPRRVPQFFTKFHYLTSQFDAQPSRNWNSKDERPSRHASAVLSLDGLPVVLSDLMWLQVGLHISRYYGTLSFCHFRARIDQMPELLSAAQQYEYEPGRHQGHTHHPGCNIMSSSPQGNPIRREND